MNRRYGIVSVKAVAAILTLAGFVIVSDVNIGLPYFNAGSNHVYGFAVLIVMTEMISLYLQGEDSGFIDLVVGFLWIFIATMEFLK